MMGHGSERLPLRRDSGVREAEPAITDGVAGSAADRPPLSRRGSGVVKRDVVDLAARFASDKRFVAALVAKLGRIRSSAVARDGRSGGTAAAPEGSMALGECNQGFSCSGSTASPMHAYPDDHNLETSPKRGNASVSPEGYASSSTLAAAGRSQEASRKRGGCASSSMPFVGEYHKHVTRKREPSGKAPVFTWGCASSSKADVDEQSPHAPSQKRDRIKPATAKTPAKELDLDSDDGKEWQADGASPENDSDAEFLSLQEQLSKRLGS